MLAEILMLCSSQFISCDTPKIQTREVILTAYNSEVGQTDDTPFQTASGKQVNEKYVAMNGVKFGTHILYNGQEYEVQDRKNSRYDSGWVDLWKKTKAEAKQFGVKKAKIVLYENP